MSRKRGTDTRGGAFPPAVVQAVWGKARQVPSYDAAVWRYDPCGKPIKRVEHGNTTSANGWEVDHIKPVAKGGTDELANLQAIQWELNREKGDTYPWTCP